MVGLNKRTVGMPHRSDELHLRRVQGEVFWEGQASLEEATLAGIGVSFPRTRAQLAAQRRTRACLAAYGQGTRRVSAPLRVSPKARTQ